ncbi:MAG: hypothetical protein ACTH6A_04045 [Brachybacterium tyrofermentans]|uniref:hypothetical protein n=1 Tax=Brachybacterium tyrofermentans TaxID=47848 RepID=UPI003F90C671
MIGYLALRPVPPGTGPEDSRSTTVVPAQPPDSERRFLAGYDATPERYGMTDPATASGEPVSARLTLENDAVETGGALGLSFDARELASPMWGSEDSNLTLTLSELDRPALRFGGNGVDRHLWWTSGDEPAPKWAEATVTPEDLERVAAVAEEVDAQVTIDLDLGHDDPARAADMAAHAQQAFGDRLLAVAVGNEPNGFFHANQPQLAVRDASWGPEAYQASLTEYSGALEKVATGLPVSGPGAYDALWWRAFTESEIPNQRALSMHWYPLWDCEGPASSISNPTVDDLTSPAIRERAQHIIGMGAEVAAEHDLPLWLEETGPTSCPGTNDTSRTHAQALWTVDYTMTATELGVERIAFHSTLQACEGGAPMSPICARGTLEEPGLIVEGRSSYLALMMLGAAPDGKALTGATSGDEHITVHGVLSKDGTLSVTIVDMRDPSATDGALAVQLSAPADLPEGSPVAWQLATGSKLTGESLTAAQSTLTGPAPIVGEFAGAALTPAQSVTLTSVPGTATTLTFDPKPEAAASDGDAS